MSHDIRTPMNAIVGMVDIARYEIEDTEKVKNCLDKISSSSAQLLTLLNNILDMSEIEMQELKLKEVQFGMDELVENIQVVLGQTARSRKVELNFHYNIEHINLIGDAVRLRQVLMNVISNGIKYTEAFGKVDVDISELESDDEYAVFEFKVADTGVGMTQEFIETKMFKPFERSSSREVQKVEGSGIGMSITKAIIDAMKATMTVDSVVGEGTTFRIRMKFKKDTNIQKNIVKEQDGISVLDATGKNLLVVEDNEINMEIIKSILERTHAHVTCAWDAEEAIDIISESKDGHFDLIFMDIQMPGMNGYDATRSIRSMDRRDVATVPIVAMTANAFAQDVEKALNSGMNAHIAKPIDIDELFQKMYHFLYT
jgi:CheY-like chemotaxis protein